MAIITIGGGKLCKISDIHTQKSSNLWGLGCEYRLTIKQILKKLYFFSIAANNNEMVSRQVCRYKPTINL